MEIISMTRDLLGNCWWLDHVGYAMVSTPRRTEYFLTGKVIKRIWYAHQVTLSCFGSLFESARTTFWWSKEMFKEAIATSWTALFWCIVIELELIIISFIYSNSNSDLNEFLESLEAVLQWTFALDKPNCWRFSKTEPSNKKPKIDYKIDVCILVKSRYNVCFIFNHTAWKASKYGVFSGLYFPVFGLKTEIYGVNLRIQSDYMKIRTWENSVFGHFSRRVTFTITVIHIQPRRL